MRIISPSGELIKVSKVVAMAEANVMLNGRVRTLIEPSESDNYAKASGLLFEIEVNEPLFFSNNIYIGNLEPFKLREIMGKLLKDDAVDLACLGAEYKETPFNNRIGCDAPVFWCRNVCFSSGLNCGVNPLMGCNNMTGNALPYKDYDEEGDDYEEYEEEGDDYEDYDEYDDYNS